MFQTKPLAHLTHHQLHNRVVRLMRRERDCTIAILDHLSAMDRRRLYRARGHASLYVYVTEELGYSNASGVRRIRAARAMARYPHLRDLLRDRKITLGALSQVATLLTDANVQSVTAELCGTSTRGAEALAARLRGTPARRERIVTVAPVRSEVSDASAPMLLACSSGRAESASALSASPLGRGESASALSASPLGRGESAFGRLMSSQSAESACQAVKKPGAPPASPNLSPTSTSSRTFARPALVVNTEPTQASQIENANDLRFRLEFTIDASTMAKFEKAMALASHRVKGAMSTEKIFALMLEEFLNKHEPARKQKRREARRKAKDVSRSRTSGGENAEREPAEAGTSTASPASCDANNERDRAEAGAGTKRSPSCSANAEREPAEGATGTASPPSYGANTEREPAEGATGTASPPRSQVGARTRHIPTAVRDEVFIRDGGQCTHRRSDGRRCTATRFLHIDHVVPFALGGANVASNLRLLCAAHNQFSAERWFGRKPHNGRPGERADE